MIFEHIDYDLKMLIEKLRPKPFPMHYIKVISTVIVYCKSFQE